MSDFQVHKRGVGDSKAPWLRFGGFRRMQIVRQIQAQECGLACIAMIGSHWGYDIDLATLRTRFPVSLSGHSIRNLRDIAAELEITARPYRCTYDELVNVSLPCVLFWQRKHWLVLKSISNKGAVVFDPARGEVKLSLNELDEGFTGPYLEFSPGRAFKQQKIRQNVDLFDLLALTPKMWRSLQKVLVLSLLIEMCGLVQPYLMQFVYDDVVPTENDSMLTVLIAFYALNYAFNGVIVALRSRMTVYLGTTVSLNVATRLMHRMLRLPLSFFHSRHVGDIQQRFHAFEPIKQTVITGGLATMIDGPLTLLNGGFMLFYSPWLAAAVAGAMVPYVAIRLLTRNIARRYQSASINADTKEATHFLGILRSMQTIKLNGGEIDTEIGWATLYADRLNAAMRTAGVTINFQSFAFALQRGIDLLVLLFFVRNINAGLATVGMLAAFLAYKDQFMSKVVAVSDQWIGFALLRAQLARVSDITKQEPEPFLTSLANRDHILCGDISLSDVSFRYVPLERDKLKAVSMTIRQGEFVCIVGASGGGKSTLLRLLTGQYTPTKGEVLFDGLPISALGQDVLRRQMGIVTQQDRLLSGRTILENVCYGEDEPDLERAQHVVAMVGLTKELGDKTAGLFGLVGDMGSALSSGQTQRLLLARALYRQPRLLVLDEGTANIDPKQAKRIHGLLRDMPITRIAVAHNPEMALYADRVFVVSDHTVQELTRQERDQFVARSVPRVAAPVPEIVPPKVYGRIVADLSARLAMPLTGGGAHTI